MPVRYLYRLWTGGTVGTVIEIVIRIICVTKFTEMYYKIYVFQQNTLSGIYIYATFVQASFQTQEWGILWNMKESECNCMMSL